MHTAEQAKELWCPMVRHEGGNGGSFNRGSLNNNPTNRDSADSKTPIYGCQCIGDQCAMWRWGEDRPMRRIVNANVFNQNSPTSRNFILHDADELEREPSSYIETEEAADARRRGYCGMAGISNY